MKKVILFYFLLFLFITHLNAQKLNDCSFCNSQLIQPEQINELSVDEIQFLINDIYARKGYRFENMDIDLYYSGMDWYKPEDDNTHILLNPVEEQNIRLLWEKNMR
ncbi:MAG: YARHG domain-containing protein [Candidatus Azobacteroides sp.]|nr:YARHG domain-containing protein [Candidatus Azobacteroides sp.]